MIMGMLGTYVDCENFAVTVILKHVQHASCIPVRSGPVYTISDAASDYQQMMTDHGGSCIATALHVRMTSMCHQPA